MKRKKMLVADLLCGAGGSSTGAAHALAELGLEMDLVCLNHWPTAIATHTKNHPQARHVCQDIATVRPSLIVPEGYLDLLMASPSCTGHSVARGGRPTSDQQRSDPWHILTWFTELRVKRAIIENVWEFLKWSPIDPKSGRPIKSREGEYFRAWVDTIWRLGATSIEYKKLNAANYGEATTRQRFIMFIRFDKKQLIWPAITHHKHDDGNLALFPSLMPWRPAREIINWRLKGRSIFGRKVPLAPKTLERILAGALKFNWHVGFILRLLPEIERSLIYHIRVEYGRRHDRCKATDRKQRVKRMANCLTRLRRLRTEQIRVGSTGSSDPMIVTLRNNADGRSVRLPVPTLAAAGQHVGLAEPIIISPRHGKEGAGPRPRVVGEPIPTITAGGSQAALAEPIFANGRKNNKAKKVSTDPVPALDTKGGVWLFEPFVLSQNSSGVARSSHEPLPTIMTGGAGAENHPGCARPGVVEPMIVTVAHGNETNEADPNSRRTQSAEQPLGALHAGGGKYGIAEPFILSRQGGGAPRSTIEPTPTQVAKHSHGLIAPYYGSGSGLTCTTTESPLPTPTAKARFGIIMPVTHSGSGNRARDVDVDQVPTLTTAHRGELALVTAEDLEQFDILFRMLEPPELAGAMGFDEYEFVGTKTEQVKQIGNAVSVRMMKACVGAMMADAAPKPSAMPALVTREVA